MEDVHESIIPCLLALVKLMTSARGPLKEVIFRGASPADTMLTLAALVHDAVRHAAVVAQFADGFPLTRALCKPSASIFAILAAKQ